MNIRNKQILSIAVPSIISNVTVPLLGLVDLTIAGHMGQTAYIGAIAVGSMIFNVIYWIFGFLRMGTSGMTSQAVGRRDFSDVVNMLVRTLSVGILIALCFIIFQIPLRWAAIWLMHPSVEIALLTKTYFDICIWGAPAMLCLYGFMGWFIGMQNTRIPMIISVFQNIVNIIASLLLVYYGGMKIEGVALGTLIAQWSGFLAACVLWFRYYSKYARYFKKDYRFIFGRGVMFKFFTVNRDIFLRTLFLVAVNLFFTSAGAQQGDMILAVNTLLMTLFTLFSYVMDGFANAGEALSGKYYGALDRAAFDDTCRRLMIWGGVVAAMFTLVYMIGGTAFLRLITDDTVVITASGQYLWWAVAIPFAGVAAFIFDGIFIGITASRGMLVSSAIAALFFFGVYLLLRPVMHNHALWLAMIVYLAMRGLVQKIYMRKYCRF